MKKNGAICLKSPNPNTRVNAWNRNYTYATDKATNQLLETKLSGHTKINYTYGHHGNMKVLPDLQVLEWNYQDELVRVELDSSGNVAHYSYDGGGQRTRKIITKNGLKQKERLYLGLVERYQAYDNNGLVVLERWTLQVEGLAQVDTLTVHHAIGLSSPTPVARYQYRDRLGSSTIEANEVGQVISYEEYYPYGASAYRAAASGVDLSLKRYRFTGKERDEETGLDYFGVRYYASWLGRWTSGDPGGFVDGLNLYRYVRNNPVNGIDREGYQTDPPDDPPPVEGGNALGNSADEIVVTAKRPTDQSQKWDASTAAWGFLRLLGGAAQAVAGMAGLASANPVGIVLGGIALAKGFDDINTGFRQMWTGQEQESFVETATEEVYRGLGYSESEAEAAGNTMDIILSLVTPSGYISGAGKVPQLAGGGSRAATTTDRVAKLEKTARAGQGGSAAAQTADEIGDHAMFNKDNNKPISSEKKKAIGSIVESLQNGSQGSVNSVLQGVETRVQKADDLRATTSVDDYKNNFRILEGASKNGPVDISSVVDRMKDMLGEYYIKISPAEGSTYIRAIDGKFSIRITHSQVGANVSNPRIHISKGKNSGHGKDVFLKPGTTRDQIVNLFRR